MNKEEILNKLKHYLSLANKTPDTDWEVNEVLFGTLSLIELIYGKKSIQYERLVEAKVDEKKRPLTFGYGWEINSVASGILKAMIYEIEKDLKNLKWERIDEEARKANFNFTGSSASFSQQEINQIKIGIESIKKELPSIGLLLVQQIAIENKLDEIVSLTDVLKKSSWLELLQGALISIAISLAIPPENAQKVWDLIKSSLLNKLIE